jgi:serine/threonine-protein phosphatase 5
LLYRNRAWAHFKLNDFKSAIDDATRSIKLDPTFMKAYHTRGQAYFALKEYENAFKDFRIALDNEPNNKEIQYLYDQAFTKSDVKTKA